MLNNTYKMAHILSVLKNIPYILVYVGELERLLIDTNQEGLFDFDYEEGLRYLKEGEVGGLLLKKTVLFQCLELYYLSYGEKPRIESIEGQDTGVWLYEEHTRKLEMVRPQIVPPFETASNGCSLYGTQDENQVILNILASRKVLSYPSFLEDVWCDFEGKPILMTLSEFKTTKKGLRFGLGESIKSEENIKLEAQAPQFMDLTTQLPNVFYFMSGFRYGEKAQTSQSVLALLYIQQWERTLNAFGNRYVRMLFKTLEQYVKSITNKEALIFVYNQSTLGVYCDVDSKEGVDSLCEAIIEYFKTPWYYDDFVFFSSVKIGVSLYHLHSENPLELIGYANMALKGLSRVATSDYLVFDLVMKNQISENIILFGEIRSAMDNGEFVMFYQPQVSLATGRIVGAEALVRWAHPERGMVSPALFLPAINKIGLDYLLDQYVIHAVSQDQARLKQMGLGEIPISFNLSASSLNTQSVYEDINDTIMMNEADSSKMVIEITETAEVFLNPHLNERLLSLKGIGLNISIDDFGTGFSSLSYLASLPVDAVKIDKTFSDGYPHDKGKLFLIDKIVEIATCFHLDLTLEGIETEAQIQYFKTHLEEAVLKKIKIQGYYYYKPMSFDAFVIQLKKN